MPQALWEVELCLELHSQVSHRVKCRTLYLVDSLCAKRSALRVVAAANGRIDTVTALAIQSKPYRKHLICRIFLENVDGYDKNTTDGSNATWSSATRTIVLRHS